ncbi:hypothetical protein LZG75_08855 [Polynucleobacter sp. IMCC30063]|uniref:hypothetical protein n=1 Tax=Polynucleobacter sp. IMCC30063 TaxID=2907298 RepID=UPI001F305E1F|nr:hypothetical protein [Polynucleobacter sp. IMCC30063]MCE7506349.1 hypothetical protein [Polynucleobacter sp. IMCC30063]
MKSKLYVSSVVCLSVFTLASCGGGDGGLSSNSPGATSASATSATPITAAIDNIGSPAGGPWGLGYIAMGAVGGPNQSAPTATSTGGQDDFGGKPVNVVFEYAGDDGRGNPGDILAPINYWKMVQDWNGIPPNRYGVAATTGLVNINQFPTRIAMVEYTAQMSGGTNFSDFTNGPPGLSSSDTSAAYIMAKHFISLGADAQMMIASPVVYGGKNYYGTLIMNPDMLGAIQQNNLVNTVNSTLATYDVNTAVAQAMCVLNTQGTYTNTFNPNSLNPTTGVPYINKAYSGTPIQIAIAMLNDGYPAYSLAGQVDPYWNSITGNQIPQWVNPTAPQADTQIQKWFNVCLSAKPTTKFPATLDGWVQANHYMIRSFAPKGTVTVGWQDNMWAVNTGYWVHNDFPTSSGATVSSTYSGPVITFLKNSAPSTMDMSANGVDFFAFDRFELDDSSWGGVQYQATLDNARAWDNILTAVGQVSTGCNGINANCSNIPIMLFQIPGSHITNTTESTPEKLTVAGVGNPVINPCGAAGSANCIAYPPPQPQQYVFSTAPVYFFGDSNLKSDLSNIMTGPTSATPSGTMVGNYQLPCGPNLAPLSTTPGYNCLNNTQVTYQQYLMQYQLKSNNYDWSKDNGKLKLAAQNNVFAILWGGGQTTSVIQNFSNNNDNGWLAGKIKAYFTNPTPLQ